MLIDLGDVDERPLVRHECAPLLEDRRVEGAVPTRGRSFEMRIEILKADNMGVPRRPRDYADADEGEDYSR